MALLPVERLLKMNPFERIVWDVVDPPFTFDEVQRAINDRNFEAEQYNGWERQAARAYHVGRVAYLVVNRTSDPISVDVGTPTLGYVNDWPILDGHHRLAAAIFRGDPFIEADVAGDIAFAEDLYGVPMPRTHEDLVYEAIRRYPGRCLAGLEDALSWPQGPAIRRALVRLMKKGWVVGSEHEGHTIVSGRPERTVHPQSAE